MLAAPASHRVLLENDRVRVLEVVIEPRTREPEHTHRAASVMIVDEPARIRYYVGNAVQFESPEHSGALPAVRVGWMEPEGPHSVENIDERATTRSASNSSSSELRPRWRASSGRGADPTRRCRRDNADDSVGRLLITGSGTSMTGRRKLRT